MYIYLRNFLDLALSFPFDDTSDLRFSFDSYKVISAASSCLLCTLSHADLTGALQNYSVLPEGTVLWNLPDTHPPSPSSTRSSLLVCKQQILRSPRFSTPAQNVRVTMVARTRVSERKDACITPCRECNLDITAPPRVLHFSSLHSSSSHEDETKRRSL